MDKIFCMLFVMILLFIAALEDLKTGIVKDLYVLSVSMSVLGLIFAFYNNSLFINFKMNIITCFIVFICNYAVYIISNLANRNGWGGADVLILSALACSFGIYIIFIIMFSTAMACIYTIIKSIYKKEKIINTSTRFLPFVFIASFIVTFLYFNVYFL